MRLTGDIGTMLANGKVICNNGPRSLLKNPPDWTCSDIWFFGNFISIAEWLAKKFTNIGNLFHVLDNFTFTMLY